jgi:hypothetical protein
MQTNKHFFLSHLAYLFLGWEIFQTLWRKSTRTFCVQWCFFPRNPCGLWGNVENIVERGRPQMTIWRLRIACWISRLCNTRCFSTATILTRTRVSVTLYVHCLSCSLLTIAGTVDNLSIVINWFAAVTQKGFHIPRHWPNFEHRHSVHLLASLVCVKRTFGSGFNVKRGHGTVSNDRGVYCDRAWHWSRTVQTAVLMVRAVENTRCTRTATDV